MKKIFVMSIFLGFFSAGCGSGQGTPPEKTAAQTGVMSSEVEKAAAQAEESLKTIAVEAERSSEAINKRLPAIIESIRKLLGILEKETKTIQQELDKLPKQQPAQQPVTPNAER
jgi:hypothetical protein